MAYFSSVPTAADLRKALQEGLKKSQVNREEFEEACRKSSLTSGHIAADSDFFVVVDSILQELKDQDELMMKYESNLETNRQELEKLAHDKALIEKAIEDMKSGTAVPDATVSQELCQLTLKVNEILFGDLENIRGISPEVRKALYNRELEHYKSKGSKGGAQSAPGPQGIDLSQSSQQLSSQMAKSSDTTKSELLKVKEDYKLLQTLSAHQKSLIESIRSHKDDQLVQAEEELKTSRQKIQEAAETIKKVQVSKMEAISDIQHRFDLASARADDLDQRLQSKEVELKEERSRANSLSKKAREVEHERDNETSRADKIDRSASGLKKELDAMTVSLSDERALVDSLKRDVRATRTERDNEKSRADDEKSRADNEKSRADDEKSRADKEKSRADDEKFRADKEKSRANKEKSRADDEKSRADDEKSYAENLENDLQKVKSEMLNQSVLIRTQGHELESKSQELGRTRTKYEREMATVSSLAKELNELNVTKEQLGVLRADSAEVTRMRQLFDSLDLKPEDVGPLKKRVSEVENMNRTLVDKLKRLDTAFKKEKAAKEELKQDLSGTSTAHEALTADKNKLALQLKQRTEENRLLDEQNNQLQEQNFQLQEQFEMETKLYNDLDREFQEKMSEKREVRRQLGLKTDECSNLCRQLEATCSEYESKSAAYEALSREIEEKAAAFDELDQEFKNKCSVYDEKSVAYDEIEQQFKDISVAYDELEQQLKDISAAYDELDQKFEDKSTAYDELNGKFKDKSTACDELGRKFEDKSTAHDELNRKFEDKSIAYDELDRKFEDKSTAYDELNRVCDSLKLEINEKTTENGELHQKLEEKSTAYNGLELEIKNKTAAHNELNRKFEETSSANKSLDLETKTKALAHDKLDEEFKAKCAAYDKLNQEFDQKSAAHDRLAEDNATLDRDLKNQSNQCNKLRGDISVLRKLKVDVDSLLLQKQREYEQVEAGKRTLDETLKANSAAYEKLARAKKAADDDLKNQSELIKTLRESESKLEVSNQEFQSRVKSLETESQSAIRSVQDERDEIRKNLVAAQHQLAEGERMAKEAESTRTALEEKIQTLLRREASDMDKILQEKQAKATLWVERERLQERVTELTAQIENAKGENAQLGARTQSLLQECQALQSKQRASETDLELTKADNDSKVDALQKRIIQLEKTVSSKERAIERSEKSLTAAERRASEMKSIFSLYLDGTVGNNPRNSLRDFFGALVGDDLERLVPIQAVSRPFVVLSPRQGQDNQDAAWLRDIRSSSLERMAQLHSSLWACQGVDYPLIVFELLRLLTEDFVESSPPGIYLALPYIARAIRESASRKRAADVWLVVTAYMQIHAMCCSVFGDLEVEDLSPLLERTLGGDNPQPDQIVLAALGEAAEAVQAGTASDNIRHKLRQALGDNVLCVGSKYLATTKEWMHFMIIDVEERKIWRFQKSLAEKSDYTNYPRSVDLTVRSPVAEWPSMTFKNPGFHAEIWWGYWLLNEGETVA
ncbi:hypothetical protein FHL15_010360 [Xylaria flabelliformis]|uniref:Uncharacterized protein n=1 Tax=Xylaria flabelliformis TaxID=2512241 RepID=A0A553HLF2_9PEZI|nr:hypothetical protein FHL15_010360 [Xylaria flabelliformis]